MPKVTVLIPLFNGADCIAEAIKSIQAQTFDDWDMLVINDFGSNDGCAEIVSSIAAKDSRIRLIQAEKRLGLAESLNLGLHTASGEYIARLDADDTALPGRLAAQVAYLDSHPEIGICGTWQHHYGPDRDWVHKAPEDSGMCKARLLFWCDLCHSTLMLRRSVFTENGLYYRADRKAEDFELWTRAMQYTGIANLPIVLGEYREDGSSITASKLESLHAESGTIIADTLKRLWGMELLPEQAALFNNWRNDYTGAPDQSEKLSALEPILREIWAKNRLQPFFEEDALLQSIASKWHWAKNDANWEGMTYRVHSIDDVFDDRISKPRLIDRYLVFRNNNPSFRVRIKKLFRKALPFIYHRIVRIFHK